ncbi:sorting nexin-16 [Homalodisca vitripennis]|uniref:PX domain-containing protein n=1 Tax=Homalodisca liturata TaxID=320908 RepID=A0A1B6HM72_9HEMI|nr:sorting nexin-16 [Homalodisca vitripennis]XP_046678709.1 sorting nexin-16 [Homalodisca vitripennis]
MISSEENENPGQTACCPPPSQSSSDEGLHTPTKPVNLNIDDAECSLLSNFERLKRCASTPVLPYTSTPLGFQSVVTSDTTVQIPIVGYEVMEERARFTVYKIKIENKAMGEAWYIFRRYTDFVRLHSKLKCEFPKKVLTLPRKRWFGNNFSQSFIEERLHGLQKFIDTVTSDKELLASQNIRDFFCLDEPPSFSEIGEESRAIFEALEETIYQLRRQLRLKETEIMNMRMSVTGAQEKAVTISQTLKEVACCDNCKDKVQNISEDLQRVLCLQFSNLCS